MVKRSALQICIFMHTYVNVLKIMVLCNHSGFFSFERFNGMLGKQPHNNKSIEVQVIRRFMRDSKLIHIELPTEFHSDFSSLHSISIQDASESENEAMKKVSSIHLKQMAVSELTWSVDLNYFKLPTSSKRYVLTPDE